MFYVVVMAVVPFFAWLLGGCATEPMSVQEQRALYAAGVGLHEFGENLRQNANQVQPQYIQPVQMPAPYVPAPVPVQNYQIDTPRYQMFNGASPGQIHY